ncbi:protein SFI1 homolog isoform X3 [Tamandua tetradactyla]|uniref:protein SFI1 homolog isoform X3 n=1 Tax=Tamandua tetradactyla TaxID=48850 RepID=UPI004053C923
MERKFDSSLRSLRGGADKKPSFPKTLPNKKSSAFSVVRSQLPGTSHPVQRRTLLPGNRRGRLGELRTRSYYEQRLLQRVLGEWKEEWWVSHREWKLCVRADCHYRYYLYNLIFQTWKAFVHQQQEMRDKYVRAEDYGEKRKCTCKEDAKQKMRKVWKSWLIYVVVGRTKLQMQTTALEFRQRSILWVWWCEWRRQLEQVRVDHALHVTAVTHRALSLQLQSWSRWREQLLNVQRDRQKMVSAVKHHRHWQKWRSLKAWLEYLQLRRVKRQQKEMAKRLHSITVLRTHFCDWWWALARRESLCAHLSRAEVLAGRMALRRAFAHWKHYVLLCAEAAAQRGMAEEHHRQRLLNSCFGALKDNVTRSHLRQMRRNLAHRQQEVMLQRRFWNLWQSRIEQREEREQLSLLHAAWDHYRVTLLHKCVKSWLQYTQKRQHKQLLQTRADGHFQQQTLPAAFRAWRRLWQWHQRESVLKARATHFHRELVRKQVFAVWCQKMFLCRENRLAERMAVLHAERQLLQRSWSTWRQQVAAHCQEQRWEAMACAHHCHWQLRKTFCTWKESAQQLRTEKMGMSRAAVFNVVRLLRWAWSRWRECLALRHAERQKQLRADRHYTRTLLSRPLRGWLTYQDRLRSILQDVAARESQHNRQLLRGVLCRWRENTVARVDEAKKISRANEHYRRTLRSKVLLHWREAASMQIYYRLQEGCAIAAARKVLDRGCLRTVFWRWRAHSKRSAGRRVQEERAALHHCRRLLLEAMARWKTYHLGCIRKMLLQRQGTQFLAQRLSRSCFLQWRLQLVARKQEQRGTVRALWFWSSSLQAKAWHAWLLFVLERRRKKARLEQAAQAYHHHLLREGVTRLLRFAAGTRAFRQQLQAQQQIQAACSRHRAARRCAMLWKRKALGSSRELLPPSPAAPSRRVTFEGPPFIHGAAGAGGAPHLDAKRPRAPRGAAGGLGSLLLEAGEPQLLELNATRSARKQPRRPEFLLDPVQNQRPLGCDTLGGQGSEKSQERGLALAQPAGPSLTKPFLAEAQAAPLPQPRALLLPPSSFLVRGAEAPAREPMGSPREPVRERRKAEEPEQGRPGRCEETWCVVPQKPRKRSQVSAQPAVPSARDCVLMLPGDFTGARAHPGHDFETTGRTELEAELEGIRQQFQHYQTNKQNLRSCQRQARSLRRWLELSQEEPRPEAQAAERQVQKELEQVEAQIQHLAAELQSQHQPIRTCIARVQALRRALC